MKWYLLLKKHDEIWNNKDIPLKQRIKLCDRIHIEMNKLLAKG